MWRYGFVALGLISAPLLSPVLGEAGNEAYVTTQHPFFIFKIASSLKNSITLSLWRFRRRRRSFCIQNAETSKQ